ncbi:MAG TPA: phospho-2-dehydro-3-deoxyheptonate aldolase, partial [Candidatus Angelobacter sp.]|nr:phospho-2-dehydro-3-deoxyheptonate aldolase [Candidatus Angelobacter sp.]
TGKRNKVQPLSRAAVAVGADGLMVEVHHDPDRALSDGMQSIYPEQFEELMQEIRQIAAVLHRNVQEPQRLPTTAPAIAKAGR